MLILHDLKLELAVSFSKKLPFLGVWISNIYVSEGYR